jgi:hypothetical protein
MVETHLAQNAKNVEHRTEALISGVAQLTDDHAR